MSLIHSLQMEGFFMGKMWIVNHLIVCVCVCFICAVPAVPCVHNMCVCVFVGLNVDKVDCQDACLKM